jgi:hypothetical protein
MTGLLRGGPRQQADPAMASPARESGSLAALIALIGIGTLTEIFLIYAVTKPLSLLAYPHPIAISEPLAALLGGDVIGLRGFIVVVTLAVLLYLLAYLVSLRCRGRQALVIILCFSALFAITLLLAYPAGARDIFTNVMDGRMRWLDGFNPMVQPPRVASRDPLFSAMTYWQDEPSYYGPLWYLLLVFPARVVGSGLVQNLIAFRAITLPFVLGAAYLASRIAGARDARYQAAGALLVGWSPLLLWESAANGHNDIVMAFFAIFALERALKGRWGAAIPLLALSILTKYVTVLLVPLFLIAAYRRDGRRCFRQLAAGAIISLLIAMLVTTPFWEGPRTFLGVFFHGDVASTRFTSSPGTLLASFLDGDRSLPYVVSSAAATHVRLIMLLCFSAAYGAVALRLWEGADDLLTASFYALFAYLVLLSWWFWPWYVDWLVVLGGALAARRTAMLGVIFACSALFSYAVLGWQDLLFDFESYVPLTAAMVLVAFGPPLAYWLGGLPRPQWLAEAFGPGPAPLPAPQATAFAPPGELTYNRRQEQGVSMPAAADGQGGLRVGGQRAGDAGATAFPGGGGAD